MSPDGTAVISWWPWVSLTQTTVGNGTSPAGMVAAPPRSRKRRGLPRGGSMGVPGSAGGGEGGGRGEDGAGGVGDDEEAGGDHDRPEAAGDRGRRGAGPGVHVHPVVPLPQPP